MTTLTTTTAAPVIKWTREMIYREPHKQFLKMPPHPTTARFTPEFRAEYERETRWVPVEPLPHLETNEMIETVGTGATSCPLCAVHGICVLCKGEFTGIEIYQYVPCECRYYKRFWGQWKHVPARFRGVSLPRLQPSSESNLELTQQAKIIALLQSHARDSYMLVGRPGTGKTHLAYCLYRQALWHSVVEQVQRGDWCPSVWWANATVLMTAHSTWAVEKNKDEPDERLKPSVMVADIQTAARHGYRPCLFLDELDKIAPTESKMTNLCALIDAVYTNEGQIVATSNKDAEQVVTKWGADAAETVLRRIGVGQGAHMINFG